MLATSPKIKSELCYSCGYFVSECVGTNGPKLG
jgi:hypothetical protein